MAGKFGKFKFDDVQAAGTSTPLVPGKYIAKITEHTEGKSKGGFYQVVTKMTVTQGPDQADGSNPSGRGVVDFLTFNPESDDNMRISMGVLKSLVISCKLKFDANNDWDKKKVVGKTVGVELSPGKPNPNKPNDPVYPRVRAYFDPTATAEVKSEAKGKGKGKAKKADDWGDEEE